MGQNRFDSSTELVKGKPVGQTGLPDFLRLVLALYLLFFVILRCCWSKPTSRANGRSGRVTREG